MSNPYSDRMGEIARLRNMRRVVENQIGDEIAKAYRLSPSNNVESFAQTLGMELDDVVSILITRGIQVRIQPPIPAADA